MPSQDIFSQHEQILSKYVKSINTIDIKKVNSLTNLINSMNILAFKMGNIDKLTKVLADQISTVLKKLTEQLAIAAQTIKDAEKLQKFRENSIRKSINEISNLLAQTMKVEISQSSTPTQLSLEGGSNNEITDAHSEDDKQFDIDKEGDKKEGDKKEDKKEKSFNSKPNQQLSRNTTTRQFTGGLNNYVIRNNNGRRIGTISKS